MPAASTVDRTPLPVTWAYPDNLPVSQAREQILQALNQHQVIIVCGATGSGKSTQLPKFCLELGRGCLGQIAHTQPRRLAARALAERVAEEIGDEVGRTVGWQVRFKNVTSADTRVKLLTDGVLLNELRHDRRLSRYDTVIIDEAHERSLNIDFLLGYLSQLAPQRPDLKIIITSATLDAEKFSRHFGDAPVIEVPGKSHPIELRYQEPDDDDLPELIAQTVAKLWRSDTGDILVFLPGEREIRDVAAHLEKHPKLKVWADKQILPLFARQSSAAQQKIFHPGKARRVVLATNIAETSLTVPGIRHVIDSGLARISRYNPRSKIQNLQIEPIAQANADQRKGRCGRTAPGTCIRLYAEDDFEARPRYTEAEILRTNLASVLLQMADLGLGDPADFPFIDPPHQRYINDARRLLDQLQALRSDGRLTRTGRKIARLPVDPRLGRILLEAQRTQCLREVLPIVAALSMQDPRERDPNNRDKSDQAQREFVDKSSDFLTLLNLWHSAELARSEMSNADFKRWCKARYLHTRRMQEWRDLIRQIGSELERAKDKKESQNSHEPASSIEPSRIHQTLLCGLLDHIGQHDENGDYRGPRGARWRIHPESVLSKRRPNWMCAAEIVSTRRVYARIAAHVEPEWIEKAAVHLIQKQALEPQWDKQRGEVVAREQVSLFGLILTADRLVAYAQHDRSHARQLFILHALIEGQWGRRDAPAFLKANQNLAKRLQSEENKLRRRGILRADDEIIDWYDERLPEGIVNRQDLLNQLSDALDQTLRMQDADLRVSAQDDLSNAFPPRLESHGQSLKLQYIFAPGQDDDGVNLDVPVAQLNQLDQQRLDWLVPGMLADKIEHLVKGLPKAQRRKFVPASATVEHCLQALPFGQGDLFTALARQLQRRCGEPSPTEHDLRAIEMPPRLQMRIRLRNAQGAQVAAGRDLSRLRETLGHQAKTAFKAHHDERWSITGLSRWADPMPDRLPDSVEISGGLLAFPRLRDDEDSAAVQLFDDVEDARRNHREGLLRLLLITQHKNLQQRLKSLPNRQAIVLRLSALPVAEAADQHLIDLLAPTRRHGDLLSSLTARVVSDTQLDDGIFSRTAFESALANTQALAEQLQQHWQAISRLADAWAQWVACEKPQDDDPAAQDMQNQLTWLLSPGWLERTPAIGDLPRYIQALCMRAERWQHQPAEDSQRQALISPHWQRAKDAFMRCAKRRQAAPAGLIAYRWMIEEYRVSVFAQTLKTRQKVSEKRLEQAWRELKPIMDRL